MFLRSLQQIADEAMLGLADDMDQDEYDLLAGRKSAQQVAYVYVHGDCDHFAQALHEALGWAVVSVTHPEWGLLHRAVRAPDGRVLDAEGWQDEASLGRRYRKRRGLVVETIDNPAPFFGSSAEDEIETALEAALQLPWEPFSVADFRVRLEGRLKEVRSEMQAVRP